MAVDNYGPLIQVPISKQAISASQFGIPVRASIQDLDQRAQVQEANQIVTTGSVDATGFAVNNLHGIILQNGLIVMLSLGIAVSTAVTVGATGNFADILMCTLPPSLAPNQNWYGSIGNGTNSGEASIIANGQVVVRCWTPSQNIASGTTLRISAMYSAIE
jgi:hypothetical protein